MNPLEETKDIVKWVFEAYSGGIFISSCGQISRFCWELRGKEKLIPLTGSMGMAFSLSMGLAMAKPDDRVIAIMGDGDFLMGLGGIANLPELNLFNLVHIVIANSKYQSTGGQRSVWDFSVIGQLVQPIYRSTYIDCIDSCNKHSEMGPKIKILYTKNSSPVPSRIPDSELSSTARLV